MIGGNLAETPPLIRDLILGPCKAAVHAGQLCASPECDIAGERVTISVESKSHTTPNHTRPLGVAAQLVYAFAPVRRGGRVAEGARLESVYAGNRIAGSNPASSAREMSLNSLKIS